MAVWADTAARPPDDNALATVGAAENAVIEVEARLPKAAPNRATVQVLEPWAKSMRLPMTYSPAEMALVAKVMGCIFAMDQPPWNWVSEVEPPAVLVPVVQANVVEALATDASEVELPKL